VKLTKGKCRKSHQRPKFSRDKKGVLIIKGKYAARCKQKFILRSVSTPEEHVFNAFRDFWTDLNGTLTGGLKIGKIQAEDKRFHVYSSPTLGEQIRLINKWSNNVMTKQLLLTLGAKVFGAPATPEKGRKAVLDILAENNINTKGIRLESGTGLSRIARITAKQMSELLETAYRDAYMPEFMASLSLAGVDGTLVNRFRKDDLRGRSHLKTGTLDFVSAISGYMLNRNGNRLVIVIQHNGKRTGGGRATKIQNALLRWSFEQ
jgi:D-alanyl-D-alanine carboxypeptidase/D-alanyl-D-alanine-endopeptidase (penicillin-binding protein 4)